MPANEKSLREAVAKIAASTKSDKDRKAAEAAVRELGRILGREQLKPELLTGLFEGLKKLQPRQISAYIARDVPKLIQDVDAKIRALKPQAPHKPQQPARPPSPQQPARPPGAPTAAPAKPAAGTTPVAPVRHESK